MSSNRNVTRPATSRSPSAPRWLTIALIIWVGGAAVGIGMMPAREDRPAGRSRPPAHRPVDIEAPSTHNLPAVA